MHTKLLPHAAKIDEFVTGLHGDCVQTAMAVCLGIIKGTDATANDILAIVRSMQSEGIAASNGATNINNAHDWLKQQGYGVEAYVGYSEPFNGDWLALLRQWSGVAPIVLNIANAGVLTDVETGARDEVNVRYHAVAVVGVQDDGYLVCDGDNPQADQRFQVYTRQTIEAAKPCGIVVLSMPHASPNIATGGTPSMSTPQGWEVKPVDATHPVDYLVSPNGIEVEGHIASYILTHPWPQYDEPLQEWTGNGETNGYEQLFGYSKWGVHPDGTVYQAPVGQQFLTAVGTSTTQAATIASLQTQIEELHKELANVSTQPIPVPPATATSGTTQDAIAISVNAAELTKLILPEIMSALRQQTITPQGA